MLRRVFVPTNRGGALESRLHARLAHLADLLHLRDHRVRVEDVVRMHPDWGRHVRPRLLLLILRVRIKGKMRYKEGKALLGAAILTGVEHRRTLLLEAVQRGFHLVQSFLKLITNLAKHTSTKSMMGKKQLASSTFFTMPLISTRRWCRNSSTS